MRTFWRLLGFLRPYRRGVVTSLLLAAAAMGTGVLIPALVGRTIAIVFNLQPAKLMGIESNGMVLAASPDGGKAVLVSFEQTLAPGTRIR